MKNQATDTADIISMVLDDGTTEEFSIITIFETAGHAYIVLKPVEDETDTSVYLYRYSEGEDGAPIIENILDDDEFEQASICFDHMQDAALSDAD